MKHLRSLASACAALAFHGATLAHDGHGMAGPHWHATDAGVFIALAVAIGLAVWMGKGK